MDYSIAVIVPNTKIANTFKRVLYEKKLEYPAFSLSTKDALKEANNLADKGTQIILSMGVTGEYLKEHTNILVLEVQYTTIEFTRAINEGLKYSDKIAVIGSESLTYLMKKTIEEFGKSITVFKINKYEPIEDQAMRVIKKGYDVIISGRPSADVANKSGKIGINPDIDEKTAGFAIENAQYILRLLNESAEKYETMKAILDCTLEGIIGTDNNNFVTFMNPTAEKLIGGERDKIYQKQIDDVLKENNIVNALNEKNLKYENDKKYIIINSVPIMVKGSRKGTVSSVKEVSEIRQLEQRIRKELLVKGHYAKSTFDDIIGDSAIMKKAKNTAKKYAEFDSTILILGETGTGKEIFAQSIHNESNRKNEAFVAVNCGSIPENLIESELFGYVKGAFTGARQEGKEGLFEMAHNGTIFLDEINEMPMSMQPRFLRVLQEKEIVKIGDDRVIPINVRVISASNENLIQLVKKGKFREDLYYRLCVLQLKIPPLRQRSDDVKDISEYIIRKKNRELGKSVKGMSPELIKELKGMEWNGNVRQLSNLIERMMVLCENDYLDESILGESMFQDAAVEEKNSNNSMRDIEIQAIYDSLKKTGGNKKEAAELLEINPSTLWRKLKKLENNEK